MEPSNGAFNDEKPRNLLAEPLCGFGRVGLKTDREVLVKSTTETYLYINALFYSTFFKPRYPAY